ncbi:MAG: HAMP domain-containing histidine kinase [Agarilytica sp.]
MINKLNTLHSRLTLALFVSFLGVGIFTATLLICSSRGYHREVTQVMHKDLAEHVVKNYLLFNNGEIDLEASKKTFHDLMTLGPNFEFYVLDKNGEILTCSADPIEIERQSVSLNPVNKFLNSPALAEPIFGEDPRGENRKKIFSVAPIYQQEELQGYLYVILGSEVRDQVSDMLLSSQIIRWGLWVFISGLVFALLATLWLTGLITRPLTKLTQQINKIQKKGFSNDTYSDEQLLVELDHWSKDNHNEINTLGSAFKEALEKIHDQYQNIVTIDELRKELLSHVSHDLRTPLASLLGYLETWEINQANLTDEQSKLYIATAKKSAQRISSLVEQLFELAYLDSGNVQVTREPFSIAELIQDVLQKYRIIAQKKNVSLNVQPQDSSIFVMGDIEKLERVFSNLIENSVRHCNEGGKVTVQLNQQGQFVAIDVSDDGIGIPDEDIPHIFDAHYKAGNSVRGNTAHGGLGLAITKRLLELHQSHIKVDSHIGRGTTFSFNLQTNT